MLHQVVNIFHLLGVLALQKRSKILYYIAYSLKGNLDPVPSLHQLHYCFFFLFLSFFLFWLRPWHRKVPRPGIKTTLQLQPAPNLRQCGILYLLHHKGTSCAIPSLSLQLLPSLISNCLNIPFRTQGRSKRLNETYLLQTRNGGTERLLYPGAPQGPAWFHKVAWQKAQVEAMSKPSSQLQGGQG